MIIDIFKTSVYKILINDPQFNKLILEELYNPKYESFNRSNQGGMQIHPDKGTELELTLQKHLINYIPDYITGLDYKNIFKGFIIDSFWINENKKHNYNHRHMHPDSHISGVYYCKVPEKSGRLFFEDIYSDHKNLCKGNLKAPLFETTHLITPEERALLLFPSWLHHHVEPSETNEPRISLSFNIRFF